MPMTQMLSLLFSVFTRERRAVFLRRARIADGLVVCGLLFLAACSAWGQAVRVHAARLSPGNGMGLLGISATPSLVSFNLVPNGVAPGSMPVDITTTWRGNLCFSSCTINVYGYFASPTAALSGGSANANIPSSAVLGEMPTGTPKSFTAFTQSSPFGGASSLEFFSQAGVLFARQGSRTDALTLEIDLTHLPRLAAGDYTGTLYIQAQSL